MKVRVGVRARVRSSVEAVIRDRTDQTREQNEHASTESNRNELGRIFETETLNR